MKKEYLKNTKAEIEKLCAALYDHKIKFSMLPMKGLNSKTEEKNLKNIIIGCFLN